MTKLKEDKDAVVVDSMAEFLWKVQNNAVDKAEEKIEDLKKELAKKDKRLRELEERLGALNPEKQGGRK